jgi:flagellar basal body rod protein FlgC
MNSIASISLSGMSAAMLGMRAAAHNIANLQTGDFRRQLVQRQAQAEGGVTVSVAQAPQRGNAPADDMVEQMTASYLFKASLLTLQTERQMLGSLLDIEA